MEVKTVESEIERSCVDYPIEFQNYIDRSRKAGCFIIIDINIYIQYKTVETNK